MALLPSNISFSRQVLIIVAVIGMLLAAAYIAFGLPDRELSEPTGEPPTAPTTLANEARVAGSGVVEPSSELVQIGTALAGLVTDLRVRPGDFVEKGQPLFVVDTRALEARASETRTAIQEARAAIAEAQAAVGEARTAEATAARQLQLYRNVSDPAAVSQAEVIRAEGDAAAARERRGQAQARLSAARARLDSAQAQASSARTEIGRATDARRSRVRFLRSISVRANFCPPWAGEGNRSSRWERRARCMCGSTSTRSRPRAPILGRMRRSIRAGYPIRG